MPLPKTPRLRIRLPRTRRGQRRALWALVLGCVLALAPATWMQAVADSRVRTVADAPRP